MAVKWIYGRMILLAGILGAVTAQARIIALAPDAVPAEATAARELQSFIAQMTGETLAIVRTTQPEEAALWVGQSPEMASTLGVDDFTALAPDGIIVESAGPHLIVSGARPRGTLYAAYELLEHWGVRFWTSQESDIPQRDALDYSGISLRYQPPFPIRDLYHAATVWGHPEFAARMRVNGHTSSATAEYGGHESILGFCHTFDQLLPAEELLGTHPEWFSLVNGERVGGLSRGQLCLSNPEMRAELIRRARKWLEANPEAMVISIAQNDTPASFCECDGCRALTEREQGRQSGVLLDFVNEVAFELEKFRPGVVVETLAYNYTLEPPVVTMPRGNVMIRLCVIGANFCRPLDSETNAAFRDSMRAWSQVAATLGVWNYMTNFKNYLLPHPNWDAWGDDMRFFRDHHAKAIFAQLDALSSETGGDMQPLRCWVAAKLLWNPDLDSAALIGEFLDGYYGSAAPHIGEYMTLLTQETAKEPPPELGCYLNNTTGWLEMETLLSAFGAMARAKEAVADDPVRLARVESAQMPIAFALLLRPEMAQPEAYGWTQAQLQALAREMLARAGGTGTQYFAEGGRFGAFAGDLERRYGLTPPIADHELPPELRGLPRERLTALRHTSFIVYEVGSRVFEVADANAHGGLAWRMAAGHGGWLIQHALPPLGEGVRVYAALRLEKTPDAAGGPGLVVGVHGDNSPMQTVPADALDTAEYRYLDLGVHNLSPDCYFYCAPVENSGVSAIVVDELILVVP